MKRPLHPILFALLLGTALAEDERQVEWVGDWEQAFKTAVEQNKPVMVCINSKDGESANERTVKNVYRDPEFVAESRRFVMIVISTLGHSTSGTCPRFGKVTCEEHLACWKQLASRHGDTFRHSAMGNDMISPQHAWFRPDGTLLQRLEFETRPAEGFRGELLKRMRQARDDVANPPGETTPGEEAAPAVPEGRDAPLSEKDKAELARLEETDKDGRRAALANLLVTEKFSVHEALVALLQSTRNTELKCDILRAFGRGRVLGVRTYIEEELKDRNEVVRSFAAVALEDLAVVDAVPALAKRKTERDTQARKNVYRALGACGGPAADKDAAKLLLRAISADKQNSNRKHAALALRHYASEEARALVVKGLEKIAAKSKDYQVRGGVVYTLAFIGNRETTLPIFEELLEDANDPWARGFLSNAIAQLKGEGADWGRSAWWLFSEDREDPARVNP